MSMSERRKITETELAERFLGPFCGQSLVFWPNKGFIVWRPGTGGNVELLHIRTFQRGRGWGRELVREMVRELEDDPPFHSVFGFTRVGNSEAHAFYGKLGFALHRVPGVYRDGEAMLFCRDWESLRVDAKGW